MRFLLDFCEYFLSVAFTLRIYVFRIFSLWLAPITGVCRKCTAGALAMTRGSFIFALENDGKM